MVLRPFDEFGLVRVAVNAAQANRPLEMLITRLESGSKVPTPFPGIPGEGRRKQVAVSALDQEGNALLARADDIPGLPFVLDDDVMLGVLQSLRVDHIAVSRLDLEPEPSLLEGRLIPERNGTRRGELVQG